MSSRSPRRLDAESKVTGAARYIADLSFPDLLYAKVVRSTMAHGTIDAIHTESAAASDGVVAVLVGEGDHRRYGHITRDQPVLADGRVRYSGEPVAMVVATSESAADQAVGLVDVDYRALPVVTVDDALAPGTMHLHDPADIAEGWLASRAVRPALRGNVSYEFVDRRGSVEHALAAAGAVVEGEYTFPSTYQYAMEPHGAVASYDGTTLEIWSGCQHPFLVRLELAKLFDLPPERVRVHVPFIGGGFGSKSYTTVEPLVALAAIRTRRTVRLINTVEESMVTSRQHNMRCWMRTSVARDGTLLSREAVLTLDTGAYATNGPTVGYATGLSAPGPYRWTALSIEARTAYTNRPPAGSYRGFGSAHTQWISESQIDQLAQELGIGRLAIRRANVVRRGERVHPDLEPLDTDLVVALDAVAEALDWRDATGTEEDTGTGKGIGFGLMAAGAEATSNAIVRLRADGHCSISVGTGELGQGSHTVMAQVASQVLGIPLSHVRVIHTDTEFTPFDRSTGASRSTTIAGAAVHRACGDLARKLRELAAESWSVSVDSVLLEAGVLSHGERRESIGAVMSAVSSGGGYELVGVGAVRKTDPAFHGTPPFWETNVSGAEVRLDESTGRVEVLRTVSVSDVGYALNPELVAGQDEGCTLQALGHTLTEELEFDSTGELLTAGLIDYHVPRMSEAPARMHTILIENRDGPGPFGAKGCGEGPFGSVPAALVTALGSLGVRVHRLPVRPHDVWQHVSGGPDGGAAAADLVGR